MNEENKKEPIERYYHIISAGEEDESGPYEPPPHLSKPMDRLGRGKTESPRRPQGDARIRSAASKTGADLASDFNRKWGPPFWTVTGILSLVVNGILIGLLLILLNSLGSIGETGENAGKFLLGGLYSNFEKMDRAVIQTVIPVNAQVPLDITVPVQTTTQITLAETVDIPNAQVQINTGGVAINSNARVTLPAGTPMLVNMNFDLPVKATIPILLDIPVVIPMSSTGMHEPIVGLQEVIQPLYCIVDPNAANLDGVAICHPAAP